MAEHCGEARRNTLFFERLTLFEIARGKSGESGQRAKTAIETMLGQTLRVGSRVHQQLGHSTTANRDERVERTSIGKPRVTPAQQPPAHFEQDCPTLRNQFWIWPLVEQGSPTRLQSRDVGA